jgi:sigma-54 dependent transcriptional regulator, acetoin dehydrogenase operon transcriptional activator AcoR
VRVGIYSAAARFALDEIERLSRTNVPLALLMPLGGDAVGWGAIAHLSSPRRGGPYIVVYGTRGAEHELERWEDPERSPLKLADGGTLFIEDVSALPMPVQEQIARTLGRSASAPARSSVLAAGIVVSSGAPLEPLVDQGRLSRALLRWIGSAEVRVPSLMERAEDLRTLILDSLGRSGLRLRAEPLGIDPAALRLLMEHRWPGNELELGDVLTRVAAQASGRTVSAADLVAIGFRAEPELPAGVTPLPAPSRRRPPPRAPRRY